MASTGPAGAGAGSSPLVTDDMVFRHILEPMVDVGILFRNSQTRTNFNPLDKSPYSVEFRAKLAKVLDDIVNDRISGSGFDPDLDALERVMMRYLAPEKKQPYYYNDDESYEDTEAEEEARRKAVPHPLTFMEQGIEKVKKAIEDAKVEAFNESSFAKKLPEDLVREIGKYGGRRKTRRKGKKARKSRRHPR